MDIHLLEHPTQGTTVSCFGCLQLSTLCADRYILWIVPIIEPSRSYKLRDIDLKLHRVALCIYAELADDFEDVVGGDDKYEDLWI